MFELIKILHILALMFGAAASFGNLYVLLAKGPHDLPAPGFVNKLRLMFRLTAAGAIIVILVTGFLLLWMRYGFWLDGTAFGLKITFAGLLAIIVAWLNLLPLIGRKPPGYLPYLHMLGSFSLVAAAVLAVVAFN